MVSTINGTVTVLEIVGVGASFVLVDNTVVFEGSFMTLESSSQSIVKSPPSASNKIDRL